VRKLDIPGDDPMDVYNACVAAVSDPQLQHLYDSNQPHIFRAVTAFNDATAAVAWSNLPRVPRGNDGRVIAGNLTKKHLTDLYSSYMVGSTGSSRKIYDDILVSSGGLCPFCGGLGQVHTLDHYLPKSNFPIYSVLPTNLIPCCRDCNTGKGNTFGSQLNEQTLHPYLDDDKYFAARWVFAEISETTPIGAAFVCLPPAHWSNLEKLRAKRHFKSYDIASRFGVQAGAELGRLIDLRRNSLRKLSSQMFKDYLIDNANCDGFDLNGWSRTMYAALAEAEWFCEADFTARSGV
jgi:hypothetical protein